MNSVHQSDGGEMTVEHDARGQEQQRNLNVKWNKFNIGSPTNKVKYILNLPDVNRRVDTLMAPI
jgi:hypothetical protein